MSCFRAYKVPKKCFNQLRMAIVVEKIEKISKIGPETAEIEHFHSKNGEFRVGNSPCRVVNLPP